MTRFDDTNGKNPFIVYYHTVSDKQHPHLKHLIHLKTARELEADLDFLGKRYEFISLAQFQKLQECGEQSGKRKLVLTFDDGYSELSDIVQPILLRKGIPAAIFITADFLDNKDMFFRCKVSVIRDFLQINHISGMQLNEISQVTMIALSSKNDISQYLQSIRYADRHIVEQIASILKIDFQAYLDQIKPYLTQEQTYILLNNGFEIGAHSLDHPFFGRITLAEQLRQTTASMDFIQSTFKLPYRYFALPHSDAGISTEYFYHTRGQLDLLLGGFGINSYPHYHYYQRFSIEKYRVATQYSWPMETAKNILMSTLHPSHNRF